MSVARREVDACLQKGALRERPVFYVFVYVCIRDGCLCVNCNIRRRNAQSSGKKAFAQFMQEAKNPRPSTSRPPPSLTLRVQSDASTSTTPHLSILSLNAFDGFASTLKMPLLFVVAFCCFSMGRRGARGALVVAGPWGGA